MGLISAPQARTTQVIPASHERRRTERRKAPQKAPSVGRRKTDVRAKLDLSARDLLVNTALAPKNTTIEIQAVPQGRRAEDAPPPLVLTTRQSRNLLWRGYFNDLKADVERGLGWAGVHGIRGWSGLGSAVATAASVGMLALAAATPMVPGMGVVAFVAAYLLITAIGVAIQWIARRNRVPRVEPQREALESLRDELKSLPAGGEDGDARQAGEEEALLADVERLLKDIDGGFWWGMRCALWGFLDPTAMLREFGRGMFKRKEPRGS